MASPTVTMMPLPFSSYTYPAGMSRFCAAMRLLSVSSVMTPWRSAASSAEASCSSSVFTAASSCVCALVSAVCAAASWPPASEIFVTPPMSSPGSSSSCFCMFSSDSICFLDSSSSWAQRSSAAAICVRSSSACTRAVSTATACAARAVRCAERFTSFKLFIVRTLPRSVQPLALSAATVSASSPAASSVVEASMES